AAQLAQDFVTSDAWRRGCGLGSACRLRCDGFHLCAADVGGLRFRRKRLAFFGKLESWRKGCSFRLSGWPVIRPGRRPAFAAAHGETLESEFLWAGSSVRASQR